MNFQNQKNTKGEGGFTIIESMIAISIVLIGVLSALILIIRSLALAPLIEEKLIASAVAQDCIERVIQVRNSNYIESQSSAPIGWREKINGVVCGDESGQLGRFFSNSFYTNDLSNSKEIKIGYTVKWANKKGDEYNTLTVTDNLFDWGNLYNP